MITRGNETEDAKVFPYATSYGCIVVLTEPFTFEDVESEEEDSNLKIDEGDGSDGDHWELVPSSVLIENEKMVHVF